LLVEVAGVCAAGRVDAGCELDAAALDVAGGLDATGALTEADAALSVVDTALAVALLLALDAVALAPDAAAASPLSV
jgi:hypothetical protein